VSEGPDLAEIASLIGDPARANILAALLDGRALTASELAHFARVSPQTTSGHLAKLTDGKLIAMMKQGRFRYYRLATPEIGQMLEAIMSVAASRIERDRATARLDPRLRTARTCYDHFAGRLGVALADTLCARGHLLLSSEGGALTPKGSAFLGEFGIDLGAAEKRRRSFCRPCLDWTERRLHLGGAVGAALAGRCFALHWFTRLRDSRALAMTKEGQRGLAEIFGISL